MNAPPYRETPPGSGNWVPTAPVEAPVTEVDLLAEADKTVRMAGWLREHLAAGDWSSAYGAADWLMDLAEVIKAGVAEAHPDARPQVDPARW